MNQVFSQGALSMGQQLNSNMIKTPQSIAVSQAQQIVYHAQK